MLLGTSKALLAPFVLLSTLPVLAQGVSTVNGTPLESSIAASAGCDFEGSRSAEDTNYYNLVTESCSESGPFEAQIASAISFTAYSSGLVNPPPLPPSFGVRPTATSEAEASGRYPTRASASGVLSYLVTFAPTTTFPPGPYATVQLCAAINLLAHGTGSGIFRGTASAGLEITNSITDRREGWSVYWDGTQGPDVVQTDWCIAISRAEIPGFYLTIRSLAAAGAHVSLSTGSIRTGSGRTFAFADPVFVFDQEAFDISQAEAGFETFLLDEYFQLVYSPGTIPDDDSLDVSIGITPDSDPNSINPYSRGVIPVAILGSETFDVAAIDDTTLAFGPNGASIAHLHGHFEDVNFDGVMDLIVHFRTQETGIACMDESARLTGQLLDGTDFEGMDSIQTVGCRSGRRSVFARPGEDRSRQLPGRAASTPQRK